MKSGIKKKIKDIALRASSCTGAQPASFRARLGCGGRRPCCGGLEVEGGAAAGSSPLERAAKEAGEAVGGRLASGGAARAQRVGVL